MSKPVHILVVEDLSTDFDLAQREIRKTLKDCAFERVQTRKDFLKALETFKPDLILSDYSLPRFDGMKALKLAQELAPLTPFIIWTGSLGEDVAVDCMKAGAANYIVKENIKRLGPAVTHALEESHLLAERQQMKEKYEAIIERSTEGIFQSSPDGRYISVNPTMARIYGYDSSREMVESVTDIARQIYVEPEKRNEFTRLIQTKGIVEKFEMKNFRKDGSMIWTSTSARAVYNDAGDILYYEGFLQDITARRQAEESLRESEQKYRSLYALAERSEQEHALLDTVRTALAHEMDLTTILRTVVESVAKTFGYTLVSLYLLRDETLVLQHQTGYSHVINEIPITQGVAGRVARSGLPLLIEDIRADQAFLGAIDDIVSELCVPLFYKDQIIGILNVESTQNTKLSEADLNLMIALSEYISPAIGRARLYTEIGENEKRFRALIENGLDSISLLTADGTLIWESPAVIHTLDYAPNEFLGRNIFELIHPDDIEWTRTRYAQLLKEPGSRQHGTFRMRHSSGTWRWVEAVATNMLNEPSVNAIVLNYRDITERKQAEEALRASEARWRTLVQNLPAFIAEAAPDATILALNRVQPGFSLGEYVGKSLFDVVAQDSLEQLKTAFAQARNKAVLAEYEAPGYGPHGEPAWYHRQLVPIVQDDEVHSILMVASDITGRKQAEGALRESEEKYRDLYENNPLMLFTLGTDGTILAVNQTTIVQLGYDADEIIGESVLKVFYPEDRPKVTEVFGEFVKHPVQTAPWEFRKITKSGEIIWVSETSRLILNKQNEQVVFIACEDITQRKQAEEKLEEGEQRYRALFENTPVSIWEEDFSEVKTYLDSLKQQGITDLRAYFESHPEAMFECSGLIRILDVNNAGLQMYRTDSKEELIKNTTEALSEGEREHNLEDFIAIAEGRTSNSWEGADKTLTGERIEINLKWSVVPGHEQDFSRVIVTTNDITERKKAEDELRASEERFHQLADNIQEVFWITDPVSKTDLYISPTYEKIWGRAPEAQYENSDTFLANIIPEDQDILKNAVLKQEKGGKTEIEYRITRPDGSVRWIWDRAFPILDKSGRVKSVAGIAADVTERKQAENALRESEERFSNAFEFAPIGMALVSLDGGWLRVNQAICKLIGYSANELLEKTFQEITHPEDLDTDLNYVNQMLTGEINSYQMEKRYFHKSGHVVWVLLSVSLVKDGQGKPQYFISQIEDIAKRKQAEDEITRHLMELEALYENGLAIGRLLKPREIGDRIISTISRYLSWHHVTIRLRREESDELELIAFNLPGLKEEERHEVERNFNTLINKVGQGMSGWAVQTGFPINTGNVHTYPQYVDTQEGIQSGLYMPLKAGENVIGVISVESEEAGAFTAQDERLLATLANQAAIAFENARLYQTAQQELLERRRAENALRASERHYRELADSITEVFFELDQDLKCTYWNKASEALTGITTKDAIGKSMRDIFGESEEQDRTGQIYGSILKTHQPKTFETLFTLNDELRPFEVNAYPSIRGVSVVAKDVSERKQMEIALADERNQLAKRVEERTADLSRANSNLARALRVKDEFLANMSHELRTPLNAILGLSESLMELTAGPLNEKQQKYITTISESGHHLLSLINDILDLAKIEAGQVTLDVNKVDVNSVCQASLRMIKQLAQKKNQEVILDVDPGIGLMWADERRLKQMMVNLLSNAVKFTPEGGKFGLEVRGDKGENRVLITVWDNGIGIEENDLTQLFLPFVQLNSGLAREATGTGLGLALVAQMARLHGGSVSLASLPGSGSRFTIILPWEPALAADTVERMKITGKFKAIKARPQNQQTILLIEDTQEVTMMIKDYLESAGYLVATANDGLDGITQAELTHPDLILMDIQMPRMDGFEATHKLRGNPDFKYTPIIALTALAMPNDRERCLAAGMDEYITKPVNLRALVKIIQSCLSNSEEKTLPQ